MSYEFYVTAEGTKAGKFAGESVHAAHEDKIAGVAFHYSVESPRDGKSGMSTGRRIHHPVAFVKEWGAATPQFFHALCTNELLKSVLFEFVKEDEHGEEYVFHTIKLSNVNVREIEPYVDPAGGADSSEAGALKTRPLEKISLSFQRIELENMDGKTSAADEWRGR